MKSYCSSSFDTVEQQAQHSGFLLAKLINEAFELVINAEQMVLRGKAQLYILEGEERKPSSVATHKVCVRHCPIYTHI